MKKYKLADFGNPELHKALIIGNILDAVYDQYHNMYGKILHITIFLDLLIMVTGSLFTLFTQNVIYVSLSLFITSITISFNMSLIKNCNRVHEETRDFLYESVRESLDVYELSIKADMLRQLQRYRRSDDYEE